MPRYPSDTAAPVAVAPKDPDAVVDYLFDWRPQANGTDSGGTNWLASGETISSHTITADTGITVDSSVAADSDTSVRVWLSGGTRGKTYIVTCEVVTSALRTERKSISVRVARK